MCVCVCVQLEFLFQRSYTNEIIDLVFCSLRGLVILPSLSLYIYIPVLAVNPPMNGRDERSQLE